MARYIPSAEEQAAIDLLTLSGHTVLRQRSYDALRKRLDLAEWRQQVAEREIESAHRWASREADEVRRLSDRLTAVCTAAAALGVPIQDINAALDAASTKES